MSIRLTCPECYSPELNKDEGKIASTGNDYFICKDCNHNFELSLSSYEEI